MLTERQYSKLIASREYLWWDVADKRMLSLESVVEGILTKGDHDDVKSLFAELGISKVRAIFEKQIRKKRCNYRPPTINYFSLYFAHHAGKDSEQGPNDPGRTLLPDFSQFYIAFFPTQPDALQATDLDTFNPWHAKC